jgi:hypothetical protein
MSPNLLVHGNTTPPETQDVFVEELRAIATGTFLLPTQDGRTVFEALPDDPFIAGGLHKGDAFWRRAAEAARLNDTDKGLLLALLETGLSPRLFYSPPDADGWRALRGVVAMPDPTAPDAASRLFPQVHLANHPLPPPVPGLPDPGSFLRAEVEGMLAAGAIQEVSTQPRMVLPLGVALNRTAHKFRVIWDGRALNAFMQVPSVRFSTLAHFARFLTEEMVIATADLKNAYYALALDPEYTTLFGFAFEGKWYTYLVSPFGSSAGPLCFQIFAATLAGALREWLYGIPLVTIPYLDDKGLGTLPELMDAVLWAYAKALCLGGLTVSRKKTSFTAHHTARLLGLELCTNPGAFRVPDDKRARLLDTVTRMLQHGAATVKEMQGLTGFAISLAPAIPVILVLVRPLFDAITCATRAGALLVSTTTADVKQALQDLLTYKEWEAWHSFRPDSHVHALAVVSDASPTGLGVWVVDALDGTQTFFAAPVMDRDAPKTMMYKEGDALRAFLHRDVAAKLRGRRVRFLIDNKAAQTAMSGRGSRHAPLNAIAREVLHMLRDLNVSPHSDVDRITSEDNTTADHLSRLELDVHTTVCVENTPITPAAVAASIAYGLPPPPGFLTPNIALARHRFAELETAAGQRFTLDACASPLDRRVHRFVGRYDYRVEGQVATDILSYTPAREDFLYVHPPWAILAAAWKHLQCVGARGVFLFPYRPTEVWFSAIAEATGPLRKPGHLTLVAERGSTHVFEIGGPQHPVPLADTVQDDLVAVFFNFFGH